MTGGAVKQAFHNACGGRQSGQDRTHERLSGKLRILDLRGAAVRATNREAQNLLARVEFFKTSQGGFYLLAGDEDVILGARMRVEALQELFRGVIAGDRSEALFTKSAGEDIGGLGFIKRCDGKVLRHTSYSHRRQDCAYQKLCFCILIHVTAHRDAMK